MSRFSKKIGRKKISVLGATGSIGQSVADVIASAPEAFDVQVLTAHKEAEALSKVALRLNAKCAVISDESQYENLKEYLSGSKIEVRAGRPALEHSIEGNTDLTVSAITGMAGLKPLIQAIENSKAVAIANKEPLVAAGRLVMEAAQKANCKIIPIDSEHNAVFQVFENHNRDQIERIVLTASGGPFRCMSLEDMKSVTPEQALKHPTWAMGRKISIDSATMMNKALEVIEAYILFNLPAEKIEVLINPQSLVHALVEYADGSVLAQMGASDMRTPIAYALAWPERMSTPGRRFDLKTFNNLTFEPPDFGRFPALKQGYACLKSSDSAASLVLNAANEIAVEAFLAGHLAFLGIADVSQQALDRFGSEKAKTLEEILALDRLVRSAAKAYIDQNNGGFSPQTRVRKIK